MESVGIRITFVSLFNLDVGLFDLIRLDCLLLLLRQMLFGLGNLEARGYRVPLRLANLAFGIEAVVPLTGLEIEYTIVVGPVVHFCHEHDTEI